MLSTLGSGSNQTAAHLKALEEVALGALGKLCCQSYKLFFNYPLLKHPTWFTFWKKVLTVNEMYFLLSENITGVTFFILAESQF